MLLQDDNIVNNMWFSDEAHFHLDGAVNKQNMRFWGTAKPEFHAEKPLHSAKVTAWAALTLSVPRISKCQISLDVI